MNKEAVHLKVKISVSGEHWIFCDNRYMSHVTQTVKQGHRSGISILE